MQYVSLIVSSPKIKFVVVWKDIHARPDTNRTGAEGLSFYYPRLLHCLNQMLAVVLLRQHRVSSSKTVKPRAPCGYIFFYTSSTSLGQHTFPSTWKQSTIIPIFKPGKLSDSPSSYRSISLTSCTSNSSKEWF